MSDSLLSRFRGVFLGASLGEAIGKSYLTDPVVGGAQDQFDRFDRNASRLGELQLPADVSLDWSRLMLAQAEQFLQPELVNLELAGAMALARFTKLAEVAVAALPITLFYHDQPAVFRAALQQDMTNGPLNELTAGAVVVGHICSLILRERSLPRQLIPQASVDLDLSDALLSDGLVQQLMQVQAWVEQPPTLATVSQWVKQQQTTQRRLDALPIVLALYCFLSTPDDFRLSLLRLVQIPYLSSPTGAIAGTIVGAISGLYNGLIGLPLIWRQRLDVSAKQSKEIGFETEVLQSADRLLAAWSGAEHPVCWLEHPPFANLTAAPRVIR